MDSVCRFMFDHPGVVVGAVCLVVAAWLILLGVWIGQAERVREDDEV